jgi:pyruvate dehydrogenase complex dehydrogenase (E1) component
MGMTWLRFAALDRAKSVRGRPQAIVARTIKDHGFGVVADKLHWRGKPDELVDAFGISARHIVEAVKGVL